MNRIPEFAAASSLHRTRSHYRHTISSSVAVAHGSIRLQQDVCESITCPDGSQSTGNFPDCHCPPPIPEIPTSPTCESEAICPPGLVGYGSWPECACKYPDQPDPPPGGGGSPDPYTPGYSPGLGGVDNCNAMFTCPPRMLMDVDESGTCVCK
jgi:hypothetical protein